MKFTINIPVTRKRTKHGYYVLHRSGGRFFFVRKDDAIKAIRNDLTHIANNTRVITARDYASKVTTSKPPV